MRVVDCVAAFLAAKSAENLRPASLSNYARELKRFTVLCEVVDADDIDVSMVRAYLARLLADGSTLARAAGDRPFDERLVQFGPWFYLVPGEIYVEHGNQYDYYTSFRHVLDPVVDDDGQATLALPMGNLSNRYLMTQMGYFNPHASDFILNAFAYVEHGEVFVGPARTRVEGPALVIFGDGDLVEVSAGEKGGSLLLAAARPLHEPIARYGSVDASFRDPSGNGWKMIEAR
jgi:hypothetical protein